MNDESFQPGFRLSIFDTGILFAGLVGALLAGSRLWWAGVAIGFVVMHFFLFCNVFRISRPAELLWAATFTLLAAATILWEIPGWAAVFLVSLGLSTSLIARETRRPGYHGVGWQRFNPNLRKWWQANRAAQTERRSQG